MPANDPAAYLPRVRKARLKRVDEKVKAQGREKRKSKIDRFFQKINNPEPGSPRRRAEDERLANPPGKALFERLKKKEAPAQTSAPLRADPVVVRGPDPKADFSRVEGGSDSTAPQSKERLKKALRKMPQAKQTEVAKKMVKSRRGY